MSRRKSYWKTPKFWKETEKQDKFIEKVNRAIDRKHWKNLKKLLKDKKSDWL